MEVLENREYATDLVRPPTTEATHTRRPPVTAPKSPFPGQFVHIVRRTTHRRFLLRPGKDTRELTGYMYGKAVNDNPQAPCVASCMSGHCHVAHVDQCGRRSSFMQQFHSNLARKRNLQVGHRENLWAPGAPGDMVVIGLDDIIRTVLYVCLQPVAAGCVERVGDWTGFQILPRHWGKPMRFRRPELCGDDMPEFVEFVPMPPPGFEHLPLEEVIAFFEHQIRRAEKRYAKNRKGQVQGIAYCEAISPFFTPSTESPMGKLNPKFACQDPRKLMLALRRQWQFQREHRLARMCFRQGDRSVLFPAGTLKMVTLSGALCAAATPGDPRMTSTEWTATAKAQWDDWIARRRAR